MTSYMSIPQMSNAHTSYTSKANTYNHHTMDRSYLD
jgi:hypothetical protein